MEEKIRRTIHICQEHLEEAVLQLYEVRLKANTEPYITILLDTARTTIDETIEKLRTLISE